MKVKAMKQTSVVTEKEQYYLQLEAANGERMVISVGEKTYNRTLELMEHDKPKPVVKEGK